MNFNTDQTSAYNIEKYIPTQAKKTQYRAATIGNSIEARTAPNFPVHDPNNDVIRLIFEQNIQTQS